MSQAIKRLKKELKELNKINSEDFGAEPIDDSDMFNWQAFITGPKDSLYEGGYFNLEIKFPREFPFKPPKVYFQTKIYHPNFNYHSGQICCCALSFLKTEWTPDITVVQILESIRGLLANPNLDRVCGLGNEEAAELYRNDNYEFKLIAKEWTKKYAED